MRMTSKVKNILIIAYIIFMVFGVIYVNAVSKLTSIGQVNDNKEEPVKSKPAKVSLIVKGSKTYTITLQTTDSVSYLFDQLRKDKVFNYEKTRYTYGTEINSVNGERAPEGYKWKIYLDGKDITFNISDVQLADKNTYELNLVKQ
jgi:hypothetical protein